jgi:hypothetical protein
MFTFQQPCKLMNLSFTNSTYFFTNQTKSRDRSVSGADYILRLSAPKTCPIIVELRALLISCVFNHSNVLHFSEWLMIHTLWRASIWQRHCLMFCTSGSQSVLHGSQGTRDTFPGDPWMHFCNGFSEVYLLFK